MANKYEQWLDERLSKPVIWSKHAALTSISRSIFSDDVKDAILFGNRIDCETTKKGDKITVKKNLDDSYYKSLIVVYLDVPTHYYIISNHYQKRKRRFKNE